MMYMYMKDENRFILLHAALLFFDLKIIFIHENLTCSDTYPSSSNIHGSPDGVERPLDSHDNSRSGRLLNSPSLEAVPFAPG